MPAPAREKLYRSTSKRRSGGLSVCRNRTVPMSFLVGRLTSLLSLYFFRHVGGGRRCGDPGFQPGPSYRTGYHGPSRNSMPVFFKPFLNASTVCATVIPLGRPLGFACGFVTRAA